MPNNSLTVTRLRLDMVRPLPLEPDLRARRLRAPRLFLLAGGAAIVVSLLSLGSPLAAQSDLAKANRHYQEQQWSQAAAAYSTALTDETEDGSAWFQYGYALYRLERDRDALRAYEKAEALGFSNARLLATAAACAARLGEEERALLLLARAVEAGMPYGALNSMSAFDALRTGPEFQALLTTAEATSYPCRQHPESHQFDFWVGRWTVTAGGQQTGVNEITNRLEDCLIYESYTTGRGFAGASFNFYDPAIAGWRQIWIDNAGQVTSYEGGLEGKDMVFRGRSAGRTGAPRLVRMRFTPKEDGTVRQLIEASPDEGATWTTAFDGLYSRME